MLRSLPRLAPLGVLLVVGACSADNWPESGPTQDAGSGGASNGLDHPATDESGDLQGTKNALTGNSGAGGGGASSSGGSGPGGYPTTLATLCPAVYGYAVEPIRASAGNLHSMVSATRVREWLQTGYVPPPDAIRGNDLVNFYNHDSTSPTTSADGFDFVVELAARSLGGISVPTQYDLYVSVQAKTLSPRPPVVLTVLVETDLADVSLERARAVVAALGKGLAVGDHVTLLTTDPSQPVQRVDVTNPEADLGSLAAGIEPGQKANFVQSVQAAYGYADGDRRSGAWNRVLYVSTGAGDTTLLDSTPIAAKAAEDPPIFFESAGVGPASGFQDRLMFDAARLGRGSFIFVDAPETVDKLYSTRFQELFGFANQIGQLRVGLPSWISSLDPTLTTNGSGPAPYLSPGGRASWVFHVKTCAEGAMSLAEGEVLTLELDYEDAGANALTATGSVLIKPLADAPAHPALDGIAATRAYSDALRSSDPIRIQAALALLGPLATGTTDDPFTEMKNLLALYPSAK